MRHRAGRRCRQGWQQSRRRCEAMSSSTARLRRGRRRLSRGRRRSGQLHLLNSFAWFRIKASDGRRPGLPRTTSSSASTASEIARDVARPSGIRHNIATAEARRPAVRACHRSASRARSRQSLDDADDLIAALERMIAKKQAIKQGMMQQLLTGRTRLPGFDGALGSGRLGDSPTVLVGLNAKHCSRLASSYNEIRWTAPAFRSRAYRMSLDYTRRLRAAVDSPSRRCHRLWRSHLHHEVRRLRDSSSAADVERCAS